MWRKFPEADIKEGKEDSSPSIRFIEGEESSQQAQLFFQSHSFSNQVNEQYDERWSDPAADEIQVDVARGSCVCVCVCMSGWGTLPESNDLLYMECAVILYVP